MHEHYKLDSELKPKDASVSNPTPVKDFGCDMIEDDIIPIVEASVNPTQPAQTVNIPMQKLEGLEICKKKDYIL